jgi:1-acyl-sn-glycerol-3-phosphate acyltransferase
LNFFSSIGRFGADKTPLFGNYLKLCQMIIVDRDKRKSRVESVQKLRERLESKQNGKKWPPVGIFPEGTCTNRKALVQFKPGKLFRILNY